MLSLFSLKSVGEKEKETVSGWVSSLFVLIFSLYFQKKLVIGLRETEKFLQFKNTIIGYHKDTQFG